MKKLLISYIFLLASCSGIVKNQNETVSFDKILNLVPSKDNQASVVNLLGHPDQKLELQDLDGLLWIYNDKKDGYQRLSLVFDKKTDMLQSVLWSVRSRDPEIKIENSKKKFPTAQFLIREAVWENSHAGPDESFYVDDKKGISITFRKTRQEVESIGWSDPNLRKNEHRTPAATYKL